MLILGHDGLAILTLRVVCGAAYSACDAADNED